MELRNMKLTEVSLLSDGTIGLGFMHKDPLCTCEEPPFRGFCAVHDTVKPDCLQHGKHVHGITDMKELAKTIGDLNYETLDKLLWELSQKILNDSLNDRATGRTKLADQLYKSGLYLGLASVHAHYAWEISKPFMYGPSPLLKMSQAVQNYMDAYKAARTFR